jgi:hypothetical protein
LERKPGALAFRPALAFTPLFQRQQTVGEAMRIEREHLLPLEAEGFPSRHSSRHSRHVTQISIR